MQKNIENVNNSYSNPKVSTPVEATTFQNSKSQNAVETISGANKTPIDQPNVHHIDNATVNNDTSDSTIDKETNNQLENEKNIENDNNSYSNPKAPPI